MTIKTACPKCGVNYMFTSKNAGKAVSCRRCQTAFVVPACTGSALPVQKATAPDHKHGVQTAAGAAAAEDDIPEAVEVPGRGGASVKGLPGAGTSFRKDPLPAPRKPGLGAFGVILIIGAVLFGVFLLGVFFLAWF